MRGRARKHRWATIWLSAVAAALVALGYVYVERAEAHATLIRVNPANGERVARPPLRVTMTFSEPIERRLTKMEVFDTDRERVDNGEVAFDDGDPTFASVGLDDLDPGLYTVEFSNVSTVDGHPWTGVTQFIVLNPDGTTPPGAEFDPDAGSGTGGTGLLPEPVDSALKWIALTALAMVAGAAVFYALVARPSANFLGEEAYQNVTDAAERWVVNLAHILLPIAFIVASLLIVLAVSRFDTGTSLWTYLTDVRAGQWRLAGLVLLLVALAGADLLFLGNSSRRRDIGIIVLIAASFGTMLTYSMVSHSASSAGKFWSVTSDFVHFAASAIWLGALVSLPPMFRLRRTALDDTQRHLHLANVFDRFSVLAGISVAIVMATGVFNGLVEIPSREALFDTTYGRVLLVKLGLVAVLMAVAALNAYVLKPRFVAGIDAAYEQRGAPVDPDRARPGDIASMMTWLPRTIVIEIALVVAVFASVGVLTQTSTARGEIAQREAAENTTGFRDEKESGDLLLTIEVEPNRVGTNEYTLTIRNQDGTFATDVTQARLRFVYADPANPDVIAGEATLLLQQFGDLWRGAGAYFTQPGSWSIEAGIRRAEKDDVSRTFVLPVAPVVANRESGDAGIFSLPFDTVTWNEVLGVALILMGGLLVIYRRELRAALSRTATRAMMTGAAAMMIVGAVLAFAVHTHSAAQDVSLGNPVEATTESVERGRVLYQQNCVVCHGVDGRGDGPQAASLDPAPTDFRLHIPLHTDPQFFNFIAYGYINSAMPAWRDQLSDEQMWDLVNFLRVEFSETPDQ
jgi:copper transport protein